MKKFFLVLILLLATSFGFTTTYHHHGYSVKCAKCVEQAKKWPGHHVCVAFRTTDPYKTENGKVYAKYHCMGGHYYWAELD
jgi:hypothetical protein